MRTRLLILFVSFALLNLKADAAGPDAAKNGRANANRRSQRANEARPRIQERRSSTPAADRIGAGSSKGLGAGNRVQPQTGTGRLGRETGPAAAAAKAKVRRSPKAASAHAQLKNRKNRRDGLQVDATRETGNDRVGDLKRTPAEKAERLLQLRLSKIEHLRNIAVENENEQLLDRADQLEALARRQYERRMAEIDSPTDAEVAENEPRQFENQRRDQPRRPLPVQPGFGKLTAEEAQRLRRVFGEQAADRVRQIGDVDVVPETGSATPSSSETNK